MAECARCSFNDSVFNSGLCLSCSDLANRVIARWMDSGTADSEEIRNIFGLSLDALHKRMERIRTSRKQPLPPALTTAAPLIQSLQVSDITPELEPEPDPTPEPLPKRTDNLPPSPTVCAVPVIIPDTKTVAALEQARTDLIEARRKLRRVRENYRRLKTSAAANRDTLAELRKELHKSQAELKCRPSPFNPLLRWHDLQ